MDLLSVVLRPSRCLHDAHDAVIASKMSAKSLAKINETIARLEIYTICFSQTNCNVVLSSHKIGNVAAQILP